jgi:Zn finger protein HypA/HybF involved in hydrogenase expression
MNDDSYRRAASEREARDAYFGTGPEPAELECLDCGTIFPYAGDDDQCPECGSDDLQVVK